MTVYEYVRSLKAGDRIVITNVTVASLNRQIGCFLEVVSIGNNSFGQHIAEVVNRGQPVWEESIQEAILTPNMSIGEKLRRAEILTKIVKKLVEV